MCMCVHLRSSMEPRRWQWMPFSITLFFIFFSGNRVVQLTRNSSIQLCWLANGCQRSICLCALRAEIADNHCPPWSCPHLKNSHLDNWIISPALKMFPLVPVLNPEHRRVLCPQKKNGEWTEQRTERGKVPAMVGFIVDPSAWNTLSWEKGQNYPDDIMWLLSQQKYKSIWLCYGNGKELLDKKNKVVIFLQLAPNLFAELGVLNDQRCPVPYTDD